MNNALVRASGARAAAARTTADARAALPRPVRAERMSTLSTRGRTTRSVGGLRPSQVRVSRPEDANERDAGLIAPLPGAVPVRRSPSAYPGSRVPAQLRPIPIVSSWDPLEHEADRVANELTRRPARPSAALET